MDQITRTVGSSAAPLFSNITLLALGALALAGCGGGNGGGGGSSPSLVANTACDYTDINQSLSGQLTGNDAQGRRLTFSIVDNPGKGSVTLTDPLTGQFVYTPNSNARGTDSFSFRVHNGQSYSQPATFRVVYIPRVMPLGDSITEGLTGTGMPAASQRISYRKKLYEELQAAGFQFDFVGSLSNGAGAGLADADHEGHAGWCDDNTPACNVSGGQSVEGNITSVLNNSPPDAILLHIGTNHFDTNASGVASILDRISLWAQSNHPVSVFLARIIPARDGSLDVTTFNNNVQAVAGNRPGVSVHVVDQQSALRSGGNANAADAALMSDNLHPNTAGYERMAARWRDDIVGSGLIPSCR